MLEIRIENQESAELQSGLEVIVIYVSIENKTNNRINIKQDSSYIINKDFYQTERKVFLSSYFEDGQILANCKVTTAHCFPENLAGKLQDGTIFTSRFFEEESGYSQEVTFVYKKKRWEEINKEEARDAKHAYGKTYTQHMLKNLETFELIEEQTGIEIKNYSIIKEKNNRNEFELYFELFPKNINKTKTIIGIEFSVFDIDGECLYLSSKVYNIEDLEFFEADKVRFYADDIAIRAHRIRVFPKIR